MRKSIILASCALGVFITSCNGAGSIQNYNEKVGGIKFKMVYVKGGYFNMGGTSELEGEAGEDASPFHRVNLDSYYISETEVTQALWEEVMGSNPSLNKGDSLPVGNVTWDEAIKFCNRLSSRTGEKYRLPTEAEWEFAARGGNLSKKTKYAGSNNIDEVAWYKDNAEAPQKVAGKKPNELGLYDMSGNAKEWCSDFYVKYLAGEQTNPFGPERGEKHVIRGGAWNGPSNYCNVAYRNNDIPNRSFGEYGLRVVRTVKESEEIKFDINLDSKKTDSKKTDSKKK